MRARTIPAPSGSAAIRIAILPGLLFLLLALSGSGCRPRPDSATGARLELTTQAFAPNSTFELTFDEPVIDDVAVGTVATNSPLQVAPPMPGTFTWRSRRSGVFAPWEAPRLGTRYTFRLDPSFRTAAGKPTGASVERTFTTPQLQVSLMNSAYWWGDIIPARPLLRASFNAPVDPQDLERHARFTDGVTRVPVEVEPIPTEGEHPDVSEWEQHSPPTWREAFNPGATAPIPDAVPVLMPLRLPGPQAPREANARFLVRPRQPLVSTNVWSLEVLPGIAGTRDKIRLATTESLRLGISPPFELREANTLNTLPSGRVLQLRFTRSVDPAVLTNDLATWLAIEPAVEDLKVDRGYGGRGIGISGEFAVGTAYTVTVRTNLTGGDGLPLAAGQTLKVEFSPVRPAVWLTSTDDDQLASGNRAVKLLAVNTPGARLRIKRLSRDTLIPALRAFERYRRSPHETSSEGLTGGPIDPQAIAGRSVLDTNLVLRGVLDAPVERRFTWDQLVPGRPTGAYFATVQLLGLPEEPGRPSQPIGPQTLIQLTDLGIGARLGRSNVVAWIFSHTTAAPVAGARVALCSSENEFLHEATTGPDGLVTLPVHPKGDWIVAEHGEDLHALHIRDAGIDAPWQIRQHGVDFSRRDQDQDDSFRVFAFTDREAYRPGEIVHLKVIARRWQDGAWALPTNRTATVAIEDPREERLVRTNLDLGVLGTGAWSWTSPKATRGTHKARITLGEHSETVRFEVRDFQPAAFEVDLAMKPQFGPEETVEARVSGRYLFGQPLQKAQVRWNAQAEDFRFIPPDWAGFVFGPEPGFGAAPDAADGQGRSFEAGTGLFRAGQPFVVTPQLTRNPVAPRPQRIAVSVELTDLNQQTLGTQAEGVRHASGFYLGFRWAHGEETLLSTNAPIEFHVTAVEPDGKPWRKPVPVEARLVRIRSISTAILRAGRTVGYRSSTERSDVTTLPFESHAAERVGTTWIARGEPARFPGGLEPGQYEIELRAKDPAGRPVLTTHTFHVSGDARLAWHQRNGSELELVPAKEAFDGGESATFLVKSPFPQATAWVTLEHDDIVRSFTTNLSGNIPSVHVPVRSEDGPNAFLNVTLVRGTAGNPHRHPMPEWRSGYRVVPIRQADLRLGVDVQLRTNTVAPGEPVDVAVTVHDREGKPVPDAEVTLYAVDEGFLSLSGTELPDPSGAFERTRTLGVRSALSLPHLLDEDLERRRFGNKGHMAGGGGRDGGGRRRFIPCPYWNPSLRTDAQGRVSATFAAPDSLTRYRVAAVVVHGARRMGSAAATLQVRKTLMLEPTLPRFVHVGDRLVARALVFNRSPMDMAVEVVCRPGTNAAFAPGTQGTAQVRVAAGAIGTVEFPVEFLSAGSDPWRWRAVGGSVEDAIVSTLPVTHAAAAEHHVQHLEIPATGRPLLQDVPPSILENPESVTVRIARGPLGFLGEAIRRLVHYPYGCAEQTGSSTLPWIALRSHPDLLPVGPDLPADPMIAIQAGVDRYWTMQTSDGGIAYWPGEPAPQRWATAYAAWILALAREAGAEVPEKRFNRVLEWLELRWRADADPATPAVLHERCLTALALSTAGRTVADLNQRLLAQSDALSAEDRALLAVSLARDGASPETIRPLLTRNARPDPAAQYGGRSRTLALRALAWGMIAPESPETSGLVKELVGESRGGHWQTTQGNAWALWALSRRDATGSKAAEAVRGEIRAGTSTQRFEIPAGRSSTLLEMPLGPGTGTATLTHEGGRPVLAEIVVTGRSRLPARETAAIQRGFALSRTYAKLDEDNRELPAEGLRTGDRVVVTLDIHAPEGGEWTAIEDPLPALLEPVQAVFRTERAAGAPPEPAWNSDFREMRLDRMLFFKNHLPAGNHRIRYLARVRAAGDVVAAPARIEAMYQPEQIGLSTGIRLQATAE